MGSIGWLIMLGVLLPTAAWMALAIYCHVPWPRARLAIAALPLAAVTLGLWLLPPIPWGLAVWLGLFAATLAWWFSLRPRADRDWADGMAVLPRAHIDGNAIRISQFRNFGYEAAGRPIPRYEERTFDLTRLRSIDYFLSHGMGPIIAHTLVSFGFDDGQFLTLSVEARRRRGQAYSPWRGLFRSYELMYVLGDERDIVRLRTNVRRERVYLYRVRLPVQDIRLLLLDYLERVELLAERPEWYNSLLSNCTTNLFWHAHRQVRWWLQPGIVINGLSARTLYRMGALPRTLPFKELQARSAIRELALASDDASEFSRRIRTQLVE